MPDTLNDVLQKLQAGVGTEDGYATTAEWQAARADFKSLTPQEQLDAGGGTVKVDGVTKTLDPKTGEMASATDLYGAPAIKTTAPDPVEETVDMLRVPEAPGVTPPPESQFTMSAVQQILDQYGVRPMSEAEIMAYADALVERQSLGQVQAIERNLARFEEDFPDEFERAKTQIMEAAAELSADRQEEMAARGLYYSSIMRNAIADIDETTMDHISEIARDAARYISELHKDLQDVEQWTAIEREVMRHQIGLEERDLSMNLSMVMMDVMKHGDLYALDAWAQEQQLILQDRDVRLREMMADLDVMERQADWAASARLASSDMVQAFLQSAGITPQQYQTMSLPEQAALVRQAMQVGEWSLNMESMQLQNRIIAVDTAIQETYGMATAHLAYTKAGIDVDAAQLDLEDLRMKVSAMGNLNYYERMMSLDLAQAAAQLDLTRAQTAAALAAETSRLTGVNEFYSYDGLRTEIHRAGELAANGQPLEGIAVLDLARHALSWADHLDPRQVRDLKTLAGQYEQAIHSDPRYADLFTVEELKEVKDATSSWAWRLFNEPAEDLMNDPHLQLLRQMR